MESSIEYKNSDLILGTQHINSGEVGWRSPSNLAIIKYWGKHGKQLPRNPSISFTLTNAYTETKIAYAKKETPSNLINLAFLFEGVSNKTFEEKILKFLTSIIDIFPFLKELDLKIESHNSFPHSAGIASSASSMSALALCLCSLENRLFGSLENKEVFLQKASFVARLGSGSACRSVYSTLALWGQYQYLLNSSDLYAIPFNDVHPIFQNYTNDILIVSREEKAVSSTAGHALMENNIYAKARYEQANLQMDRLLPALRSGDIETFGAIAEAEALTLHALMMASQPPYILIKPNTLIIIEKLKAFRRETKLPLYFSLDAGPNPHLLYPNEISKTVKSFIATELAPLCQGNYFLEDQVGEGPVELTPEN